MEKLNLCKSITRGTYGDGLAVDVDLELVTQGLRCSETYLVQRKKRSGKGKNHDGVCCGRKVCVGVMMFTYLWSGLEPVALRGVLRCSRRTVPVLVLV